MFNLIVFQGPSGSGKSTLQEAFDIHKVISWTSRAPRPGEENGVDYHFTTESKLLDMKSSGDLLEMAEYNGNFYATSKDSIQELLEKNIVGSIVVDSNGAKELREFLRGKALFIGVHATREECEVRLKKRAPDNQDFIIRRLETYEEEIKSLKECDIIICNSDNNKEKVLTLLQVIRTGLEKGC